MGILTEYEKAPVLEHWGFLHVILVRIYFVQARIFLADTG